VCIKSHCFSLCAASFHWTVLGGEAGFAAVVVRFPVHFFLFPLFFGAPFSCGVDGLGSRRLAFLRCGQVSSGLLIGARPATWAWGGGECSLLGRNSALRPVWGLARNNSRGSLAILLWLSLSGHLGGLSRMPFVEKVSTFFCFFLLLSCGPFGIFLLDFLFAVLVKA